MVVQAFPGSEVWVRDFGIVRFVGHIEIGSGSLYLYTGKPYRYLDLLAYLQMGGVCSLSVQSYVSYVNQSHHEAGSINIGRLGI